MSNDNKTNLTGRHGANSSFSSIVNMFAKAKQATKYQTILKHIKSFDFGDSEKQSFTSHANKRYYVDLSKNVSGQASRNLLAFFVPDNSAASQAVTMQSSTTLRAHLSVSRGHSLISIASHLLTDYDGLTLQNKRAERRICRAVTNVTESKTRHPIPLPYSVALTQKTLGGYHA
ncbi:MULTISPECIES: hypothetical protein [Psychrobacter]|uniref:hypothetical protein n=1 Tax=Psychrobacter TaxID=497 RepID=UPI000ED8B670|nr:MULTISPECIES: hypothetical protein [Psychrobacter]HCR88247.1 hypothetical protein [Psychrobacter sp.]